MDATLSQILSALYQAHEQIDALQQRIAVLEAKVAAMEQERDEHDCRDYGEEELANRGDE